MSGNLLKQWQEFLASLPAGVTIYPLEPQLAIEDEKTPAEWYNGADLTRPPFKPGDKVMLDIEVRKDELWMVREPQVVRELHATPVDDGIKWDIDFEADISYLVTANDVRRVFHDESEAKGIQPVLAHIEELTRGMEEVNRHTQERIAASGIDLESPPLKKADVREGETVYDHKGREWTVGKGKQMIPSFSQPGIQGVQGEIVAGKAYPFKDAVKYDWGWSADVAAWRRGRP